MSELQDIHACLVSWTLHRLEAPAQDMQSHFEVIQACFECAQ